MILGTLGVEEMKLEMKPVPNDETETEYSDITILLQVLTTLHG